MGWLAPLRRWRVVDWLLTRWELYWALLDQLGLASYAEIFIRFAIAAVLGGWTYMSVEALPIAIACAIVVFAALMSTSAVRTLAGKQTAAAGDFTSNTKEQDPEPLVGKTRSAVNDSVSRLETLERYVVKNNDRIFEVNRDCLELLDVMQSLLALNAMKSAVAASPTLSDPLQNPNGTDSWLAEQEQLYDDYLSLIRKRLGGSYHRSEMDIAIKQSEIFSERRINEIPSDERPKGVDPYALRRALLAKGRCDGAIQYMQNHIREAEEKHSYYAHKISERLAIKNNQSRN